MDPALVLGFWGVAALLVCTPGADWAFAVTAGLGGRTLPSIGGILFGYVVVACAVAVGLGALVAANPVVLDVLTVGGALYLLWLGIGGLVRRSRSGAGGIADAAVAGGAAGSPLTSFLRGAGVSGFNPKGLLLLVALVPQFTSPHGWTPGAQMLLLGGLFVATCAVVYLTVAVLARRLLAGRPRGALIMARVSAIAMTLIGVSLLVERAMQLR